MLIVWHFVGFVKHGLEVNGAALLYPYYYMMGYDTYLCSPSSLLRSGLAAIFESIFYWLTLSDYEYSNAFGTA